MREYKIAKGWAIFIYITAPFIIALFGWVLVLPFLPGSNNIAMAWFLVPVSLGMIALMGFGILDTAKGKIVIDHEKISAISVLSTRQMMLDEIKGYRTHGQYTFIEAKTEGKKKIKIHSYLGKSQEIKSWLASSYPDLDALDAEKEEKGILANTEFGRTPEEREMKLTKARTHAKIINWAGGLAGAWGLFLAEPYEYAMLASIAMPVVAIMTVLFSGGMIRIDERKDSAHPSVFIGLFTPVSAIFLRALLDFNLYAYDHVWTPSIASGLIFMALIGAGKGLVLKKMRDYFAALVMAVLSFAYGYGATVSLNCFYDNHEPDAYATKIISKRISSGKSTTYYFTLTPWGKQTEPEEVSVSSDLYNQLDPEDGVHVYFFPGLFDIPWFYVNR